MTVLLPSSFTSEGTAVTTLGYQSSFEARPQAALTQPSDFISFLYQDHEVRPAFCLYAS
jgi:hypothetical protein